MTDLAAGWETSISRRMAWPSLVRTMPVGLGFVGFWVFRRRFFFGRGGGDGEGRGGRRRGGVDGGAGRGGAGRGDRRRPPAPLCSCLSVPCRRARLASLALTAAGVQEHLEHGARAQRRADDVGDRLCGWVWVVGSGGARAGGRATSEERGRRYGSSPLRARALCPRHPNASRGPPTPAAGGITASSARPGAGRAPGAGDRARLAAAAAAALLALLPGGERAPLSDSPWPPRCCRTGPSCPTRAWSRH